LVVVDGEGPELPGRDIWRQGDLVGLAPVKILAPGIDESGEVLRAYVRQAHDHRRRNEGGGEEHGRPRIQGAVAGGRIRGDDAVRATVGGRRLEVVAADEERVEPRRVGVVIEPFGRV